jgi:chromosome segregation and condensation protein ScpB
MWENIVEIHSILKKKNYKAKFLTSSILKKNKIDKDNFEKKINKKRESWEKRKVILEKKKKKGEIWKKKDEKKNKKVKKKKGMHCGLLLL